MKKILYFVRGVPSHAELMDAQDKYALIRDCTAWHDGDCFEECDLVIGKAENIPGPYKHLWQGNNQAEDSVTNPVNEPVNEPEIAQPVSVRGRGAGRAANTAK